MEKKVTSVIGFQLIREQRQKPQFLDKRLSQSHFPLVFIAGILSGLYSA